MIASLISLWLTLGPLVPLVPEPVGKELVTLTATVVRDEGRTAIADVVVVAVPDVRRQADVQRTRTGPDGEVQLELVAGVPYSVLFDGRDQGACAQWRSAGGCLAGTQTTLDVRLPALRSLPGRLVTEAGEPVEGARVHTRRRVRSPDLWGDEPHAEATTDDDGRFVLRSGAGDYLAWVTADGFAPCLLALDALRKANEDGLGTIVLKRPIELRGTIDSPQLGDVEYDLTVTVPYAELISSPAEWDGVPGIGNELEFAVRSAPGGSFRVEDVPSGVTAHVLVSLDGTPVSSFEDKVVGDPWRLTAPACVPVTGRVTFPDGSAFRGGLRFVAVDVPEYSWGGALQVSTDADGEFEIATMPAGTWRPTVYASSCGPIVRAPDDVVVDPEALTTHLLIELDEDRSETPNLLWGLFGLGLSVWLALLLAVAATVAWFISAARRKQREASGPWGDRLYDRL